MSSNRKTTFETQGKQLSHALYSLNLGSQTKDAVLKPSVGNNRSPVGKPTSLARVPISNTSPNKSIEESSRDVKTKSPLGGSRTGAQEGRSIRSPTIRTSINNEQQRKLLRPQSSTTNSTKQKEMVRKDSADKSVHQNFTDAPGGQPNVATSNNIVEDNMTICKICGRKFLTERISAHEKACNKLHNKKRKVFVARKMVEGQPPNKSKVRSTTQPKGKSNWRKTHEEFVANIRAARQAQKILDAGGSLADLPPPPPSDTSHLTPCPHCGRKFSESAAARHIPLCKEKALRAKVAAPRGGGGRGAAGGGSRGSRLPGARGAR